MPLVSVMPDNFTFQKMCSKVFLSRSWVRIPQKRFFTIFFIVDALECNIIACCCAENCPSQKMCSKDNVSRSQIPIPTRWHFNNFLWIIVAAENWFLILWQVYGFESWLNLFIKFGFIIVASIKCNAIACCAAETCASHNEHEIVVLRRCYVKFIGSNP